MDISSPAVVLYPKQLAFVDGGKGLVAGTDNGHALVYSLDESKIKQKLNYPKGGLVQTVAVGCDYWILIARFD